jgi:hypothetical protein
LSLGHFLIGEPLTHLTSVEYTNVSCNSFPGGKHTNSNYSSFGSNG